MSVKSKSKAKAHEHQTQWEWNIPLLIRSVCIVAVCCLVVTAVYFWRSSSMAAELLMQAKNSQERGESIERVKWLSRYVRMVPTDVESICELAFAVDSQETGLKQNVEFARARLSAALVACGEDPQFEELRKKLRRKLIPRLLQFGVIRAPEAEQQVLLLSADEDDAEVLKWLARSLLLQRTASEFQVRDANKYEKGDDFWKWFAAQPTGQVLRMASEANLDDVDLAADLLSVCNQRPLWFGADKDALSKEKIEELAKQILERLSVKKNDGHAQFVVYVNTAISDREKANSILKSALEPAMERLAAFLSEPRISDSSAVAEPSIVRTEDQQGVSSQQTVKEDYAAFWDWQIALEGSRIAIGADAEQICEKLIELAANKADLVGDKQREDAFLRLASLRFEKGQYEGSIEICQAGIAAIPQSAALKRLIAFANVQLDRTQAASAVIDEIESDAELRLRQIDGPVGATMSSAAKAEVRQEIGLEQWAIRLLKGQLAIVEKDYVKATKLLRDVYKTTMSVSADNRVEAGLRLAACYAQLEQWDLAGQVYDECSILRPKDKSIGIRAARVWRRAGSSERASEQIGSFDSGSFEEALERAMLLASKPSSQVEKRSMLAALQAARERLDAIAVEERAAYECWRLDLLELRFESLSKDQKQQEQDSLSKLEAIAERYPDVAELQLQTAVELATFGRMESSDLAIGRLEQKANLSKSADDRVDLVLAKANVLVAKKDTDAAFKLLESEIASTPDQALKLAKVAAQIEIRENRIERAYSVLSSVAEENLDFETLALLAGIVDSLKTADPSKANELTDKLDGWIGKLKQTEGEDGTNWRYLAAERMLAKISPETNASQLVEQASTYYREIDLSRPHWGLASSLGAKIASIKGASEEAIGLWRRAIRDGDARPSTVLDLMRELIAAKRGAEAEAELQRVSGLADSLVPVSAWALSFAMKRGDVDEALALAEQLTIKNPEDVNGWVLRALTAIEASTKLGSDDEKQTALRDAAWSYLEKAHALSMGKNVSVWDARFRHKMMTDGKAGGVALLEEMLKEPALSEEVRLTEVGRRYQALKEFGLARKCFNNCLPINPDSAELHLAFADLNNAIGDTAESLNSLRKAHKAAPKNQFIRERLARSLAFARSDKPENFDLKEIDLLLTGADMPSTPRLTMIRGFIDLSRGDKERQAKAVKSLRDLSQSPTAEGIESKRFLASYFATQCSMNAGASKTDLATENFDSARRLYEELLDEDKVDPNDCARYASFLLSFDAYAKSNQLDTGLDHLAIADRVLSDLESATGSSIASLRLRVRLAKARGEEAKIGSIADNWVEHAGDLESLGMQNLWEITGQTLMQLGHGAESISWLEKVYEKDSKKFGLLAIALAREKNFDRAIELCVNAYRSDPTAVAATLVAEVAMMQADTPLGSDASQVLKEAPKKFPDSAELLEAMGTLHLMQRRLLEAVSFYEMAEKIDPKRRRTLNNLAMALSEMPMRKQEALAKIEKAVEIYGRDPDLLDTLGQVQFRNGRLQDAQIALIEASNGKDDISFRVHLAQVLLEKKDLAAAKEEWTKIKRANMDDVVLTSDDKAFVVLLNSQFSEKL